MHPIVIFLLVLPVLAVAILIGVKRSKNLSPLAPALVLSGMATALTTALLAFSSTSVPVAPYETGQGAWAPVVAQILLALYIGFGLEGIIATLIGAPYQWLASRRQR